jgi:hypothetical protein
MFTRCAVIVAFAGSCLAVNPGLAQEHGRAGAAPLPLLTAAKTPRPPPRLARKFAIDWDSLGVPIEWQLLWWTDGPKRIFSQGHTTPLQILPALSTYVEAAHRAGQRITLYCYLHGISECAVGYDRYYPVWQTSHPREIGGTDAVIHGACPGSPLGDYLLFGFEEMVRRYHIDGLYFDGGGPPVPCTNELHGHGWTDVAGTRQQVYPIFALRQFFRRLQTMLQEHVERPVIWLHSDGKMAAPVYSFVTATWEGEMVHGPLRRGDVLLSDLLSLEFCRAHQQAAQWGVVPMWLPSNFGTPSQKAAQARDAMALMLVHGTPFSPPASFDRTLVQAIWKAQADFGIERAEFFGYWANADRLRISPEDPRVKASLYQREGRRMIVVSNFTTRPQPFRLRLLLPPTPEALRDAISGERFARDGDRHQLTVEPKSFRLLVD